MNLLTYFKRVVNHAQYVQQIENVSEEELRKELARVNAALQLGVIKGVWDEATPKDT